MRKAAVATVVLCGFLFPCFGEKVFYFPHFGDGGGVCTIIAVTNPCGQDGNVTLSVYSQGGTLQPVGFTVGTIDRTTFPLVSRSSKIFTTSGLSSPVKSGFIEIRSDVEALTATALFRFPNGLEAGILPVTPARRFGLFVERNSTIETGIAVYRTTLDPVELVLYNSQGVEAGRTAMPFNGFQNAKFLGELFPGVAANFTGFLHVESSKPVTAMGLRFGGGVLSTVAVDQDKPTEQVMAEKFWGMWFMGYKIGASYVDQYGVYQIYEDPKKPGTFYSAVMSDDGDPALCYYDTKSGKYLLLCLGTTINDVYQFSFSKENEVTGCYYLQYKSDGHLSSCYTLTGMRYDAGSSTAASASHETEAAKIERLKNLDCQSCEPDSALLERIDDLKKAAGQE